MEEMTDKEPGSGDESVKIDSINGCITTSLILFRTSSLLPKASIDLESLTCAKNKFYSSFLLLLFNPEVLTENHDAIDDCLKNITMIEDSVVLECVSRLMSAYPDKKVLDHPLLEKLQSKSNPESKDINRIFSRLLHANMNNNEVYSHAEIHHKVQELKGNSAHTLFSSSRIMRELHQDYLIENRHKSKELQEAYDRRFGLIITP